MGKINDLKDQALATLKGKWGSFVGLTFVYMLLYGLASTLSNFGTIFQGSSFATLAFFLTGTGFLLTLLMLPMSMGFSVAHLHSSRQDLPADIGDLFYGYRNFLHVLGTLLLMVVLVVCGCVLLIVPGIILGLAYAMTPFLLRDHPELSVTETLQMSRTMMMGHKWELFLLELSFIGWMILGIFTFFIGYLWLIPYMQMTTTKFYEQLRAEFEGTNDESMPSQERETVTEVTE